MVRCISLLLLVTLLSSCSALKPEVDTTPVVLPTPIVHPASPNPISMRPIHWTVITKGTTAYYGLTTKDYEALSLNMSDIASYMSAQKNIITYYRNIK